MSYCSDRVAIAMSVYSKDSPKFFDESLDSLLRQTYEKMDVFLRVDGSVSDSLLTIIDRYIELFKGRLIVDYCQVNKGLAFQLNRIIERVISEGGYQYVARMDSDDIAVPDRIAKQVAYFQKYSTVSVLGSDVIEIDSVGNPVFYKKMDATHSEMIGKIIRKCPLNHPTVMFRLNVFEDGFMRYNEKLKNTQDYYLWVDLLSAGYIFSNLNEALLYFRVDETFFKRRGLKKAVNDIYSRLYAFRKLENFSFVNLTYLILLALLRVMPGTIKKLVYRLMR